MTFRRSEPQSLPTEAEGNVPGELSRRGFVRRVLAGFVAFAGFQSLAFAAAPAASAATTGYFTVPVLGYLQCSKTGCYGWACVYRSSCSPDRAEQFYNFRNFGTIPRTVYGRIPGWCPSQYNQMYDTPKAWMTYVSATYCCSPPNCL